METPLFLLLQARQGLWNESVIFLKINWFVEGGVEIRETLWLISLPLLLKGSLHECCTNVLTSPLNTLLEIEAQYVGSEDTSAPHHRSVHVQVYSRGLSFLILTTEKNNHALLPSCSLPRETSLLPFSFNIYINSAGKKILTQPLDRGPAPQLLPSALRRRKQPDKRREE